MTVLLATVPPFSRFARVEELLRGGEDAEHWSLAEIRKVAAAAAGDDADRKEFVALINKAITIKGRSAAR